MATSSSSKAKPRKQTFKAEYTAKWNCIIPSKRDEFSARCKLCEVDFTIAQGGSHQILAHLKTMKHTKAVDASQKSPNIANFLKQKVDLSVIRAETLMANYLIEHNIPFAAADHISDLVKAMFPDSNIAARFCCKRTKTTSIARTLGQEAKGDIIKKIKEVPFSLSTDGSSDRGADEQLYPVVIRYFDVEVQRVISVLLQIATTKERSTGQNIYLLLDSVLRENGIPWNKVVCFAADNAAVMMGSVAGTAAFVKKANPDVFINGCLCHRLHLTAEKGAKQLSFSPDELLTAIYYYLEKSSKRHKEFKQVQTLCGVKDHAILKHICTRWLSMERCLERMLEQWIPLQEYFKQEAQVGQKRKGDASSGPNQSKRQKTSTTSIAAKTPLQKKSSFLASSARASKTSAVSSVSSAKSTKTSAVLSVSSAKSTKTSAVSSVSSAKSTKTSAVSSVSCANSTKTSAVSSVSCANSTKTYAVKSSPCSSSAATTKILPTNYLPSNSSKTAKKPVKRTTGVSSTKVTSFSGQIFSGSKTGISDVGKVCPKVKASDETSTSRDSMTSATKAGEIYKKITDMNKLYCMFLLHTIPLYNVLNLELQQDEPKIHLLHGKLHTLLHGILVRFVNPKVIASASSLEQCGYQELCNQKADDQLIVGHSVRDLLASGKIGMKNQEEFFKSVRRYFVTVCDYIIKSFPLKDEVLMNACVADVTKRLDAKFSSVAFFVNRFHHMEENIDQLEIEFGLYQVDSLESVSLDQRADDIWVAISNIVDRATDKKKYIYLPKVMLSILSLSHSNAEDERLFSLVRKNATDFRPNLSTAVLSDILTQKVSCQARSLVCHKMTFEDKLLHKCKQAATTYNKM